MTNGRAVVAAAAGGAAWMAARALGRRRRRLRLEGRVALVTGGSRGLGLLIAEELLARGCRVAICARDPDQLERARVRLSAPGGEVLAVAADVADPAQAAALVERVERAWGGLDVLVNNAGIIQVGPLRSMGLADFEEAMAIDFWGVVHPTLAALPGMLARGGGRIANVTSIGARVSLPHLVPYSCAKFAAFAFSEGLRAELRPMGVYVTTVVPGLMRTGSPVNALFKGQREAEFGWFAVGGSSRLLTIDPRRAARRVVRALASAEGVLALGWQTRLASLAAGVAPGAVGDALARVARMLPAAAGPADAAPTRGMHLAPPVPPRLIRGMVREALRNNEYGGRVRPSPAHAARVRS